MILNHSCITFLFANLIFYGVQCIANSFIAGSIPYFHNAIKFLLDLSSIASKCDLFFIIYHPGYRGSAKIA